MVESSRGKARAFAGLLKPLIRGEIPFVGESTKRARGRAESTPSFDAFKSFFRFLADFIVFVKLLRLPKIARFPLNFAFHFFFRKKLRFTCCLDG